MPYCSILCASFDAADDNVLVAMVLTKFQNRFFQHVDAKLIARGLLNEHVIHKTVFSKIEGSTTDDQARGVIFDHLQQYGTVDSLKAFCRVIRSDDFMGVPAMQVLGKDMKEELCD